MQCITGQIARLFSLPFLAFCLNISWAEELVRHNACTDCHKSATPTTENNELIQSVTTLCLSCHDRGNRNDHAIGVEPGVDGTGELPLVEGKIACITCHNAHAKTRMLLRINTEELCLACHPRH